MEISFIIVSWNAAKYLTKCISSILDSVLTYPYEIIVVDNASSDGSPEIVQRQFPRVTLIKNDTNLGFARANNIGISRSSGRYLCLLNSDVVVLKGAVDKLILFMEDQPAVGMVGPQIIGVDGKVQRSCMGLPTFFNVFARAVALDSIFPESKLFGSYLMTFWNHESLLRVDVINGCFWLIRRNASENIGLLDERFFMYGEDIDWCQRFRNSHWKVVFYPEARVIHYGGASSANAPIRFAIEMRRANLLYWKKYHDFFSLVVYYSITLLHDLIRIFGYSAYAIIIAHKRKIAFFKIRRSVHCLLFLIQIPFKGL